MSTEHFSLQQQLQLAQEDNEQLATQLKRTEAVLDHYRQAVDNSPNAIFSINRLGNVTTWNPACVSMFRYDASIVGKHFRLLLNDEVQVDFIEQQVLRSPEARSFSNLDLVYTCSNGDIREMVSRIYPVAGENGVIHGFVFANTDVTERNRIHRELEQYRLHLEDLVAERTIELKEEIHQRIDAQRGLQASHDALVTILDAMEFAIQVIAHPDKESIFANKRLKEYLLQGRRDIPDYQLFAPLGAQEVSADSLIPTMPRHLEHFDAALQRWFLLHERSLTWVDGRTVRLQVATDITERKQIDQERQRVEKLESLGVMAGGIAHDFNNLLTGILGSLSLLQHQLAIGTANVALLEGALSAAERATSLTQQLLTFSKGGEPVCGAIELKELLKEAVTFALRGSAVKIVFSVVNDLYPIEADAGQLSQVFNNLAINAMQAMAEGGELQVTASNIKVQGQRRVADLAHGNYVMLAFSDNGPGIAEEILDKIFDPYFTTKSKGEGLGLAMVHRIVNKHRGKIMVERRATGGVTFTIFLPASDRQSLAKAGGSKVGGKACGRILVMDDEEPIRALCAAMLSHLGYVVDTVEDGQQALIAIKQALAAQQSYDAVILDLTIRGGMGGEEVARHLALDAPEVKLIASSGYSDSRIMADRTSYGFLEVLKKPYNLEELAGVLQRVLS
jgi:PAS domain S-box-containing protein